MAMVILQWYESRCEKHAELRRWFAAGRLQLQDSRHKVKADKVLSAATIPASWQSLWGIYSSFHQFLSWQSCAHFDWLSWLFQFATWQYTDVHKLSIQKWLFNNTVLFPPECAQRPVGHYRAITSEILRWTSGRELMCWCDERFSLWVVQK